MSQQLRDVHPRRVALVKRGANLRRILLAKTDEDNLDGFVADMLAAPVEKEDDLLAAVDASNGDESVAKAASTVARALDALRSAYDGKLPAEVKKAMKPLTDDDEGNEDDGPADDDEDQEMQKEYEALCKRDFSDEDRKKLAASGAAMKNGSYPIENEEDLHNAIHAIGRGKSPHAEIKAHIISRAKALGATAALPDDWKVNKEDGMTETAQAVPVKKEDGTWDLSAVPEDARAAFETVIKTVEDDKAEALKKAEEEATRAENAERIAKAVQEKIEKAEYVEIAKGLDNLAKDDTEFGSLLYSIRKAEDDKHLPEGTFEKLDTVLKAANEAAQAAFKEAGRTGGYRGENDPEAKLEKAAEEIRSTNPGLTKAQAIAKALKNDASLYDEYQKAVA